MVSKSQKQNTKFSHTPKNQHFFLHFFALVSKKWFLKTKKRHMMILISNQGLFNTLKSFNFLIQPLLEAREKNVKKFFGFLENLIFCFRYLLTFMYFMKNLQDICQSSTVLYTVSLQVTFKSTNSIFWRSNTCQTLLLVSIL